ncbi:MAG TPA: ATP-binding protein [Thermofilum sp.]|nr:ATP-binding protein [Thermofilum sp.]
MDIFRLIRTGGGERVEFKESLSDVKGIMETICAFLNSRGGYIIVGVDDSGHVKGIDIGRGTIPRLAGMIRDAIEPQVIPR